MKRKSGSMGGWSEGWGGRIKVVVVIISSFVFVGG